MGELCDCVSFKDAREGANARLTTFYASYSPDRLDDQGNIKGAEDVWKKWQGREPELFYELTRKYIDKALGMRERSEEEIANLQAEEDYERRLKEEEAARLRAEEEEARQRAEMEMTRRQAEQEAIARQQQENEHRRLLEEIRNEVVRLRS